MKQSKHLPSYSARNSYDLAWILNTIPDYDIAPKFYTTGTFGKSWHKPWLLAVENENADNYLNTTTFPLLTT